MLSGEWWGSRTFLERGFRALSEYSSVVLGEFGVVLMVGGNIPRETRVISIAIYDQVEMMQYGIAHTLSAILLILAFVLIFTMYYVNHRARQKS